MPITALLALLLVSQTPSTDVPRAVHVVEAGQSIALALQKAAPGDTIRVTPGEYRENLVIETPVVLIGSTGPTGPVDPSDSATRSLPLIRGGYEGNVIHIRAPGTVVNGIHVSEAGPQLTKDYACILVEADSVEIRNCLVTESLHGIYVKAGNHTVIAGNRIEGRLDLIESDRGNGIHLWNTRKNSILRNEILNVRDGIYFSFADSTIIEDNHIHHVRYGLHYMYSNYNSFTGNLFERNVAGAALMYSHDIEFTGNTFARCRGFRAYGILYQSMDNIVARDNLILDNSRGIFMNNAGNNLIEGNDVVDNDLAIQLNGGCDGNTFVGNNFINNLSSLLLDVSDRETAWSSSERGNYWSDYDGYDLDGDGIGDLPYSIQNVFQILESRVPEVRFYLLSPAARILEFAEKSLPILELGDARDPLPLMRPIVNNEVPWQMVAGNDASASIVWAGAYFVLTVALFAVLMIWSRMRVVRRSGS